MKTFSLVVIFLLAGVEFIIARPSDPQINMACKMLSTASTNGGFCKYGTYESQFCKGIKLCLRGPGETCNNDPYDAELLGLRCNTASFCQSNNVCSGKETSRKIPIDLGKRSWQQPKNIFWENFPFYELEE